MGEKFKLRLLCLLSRRHSRARARDRVFDPVSLILYHGPRGVSTRYMNGSRPSSRVAGSILEDPMIPTHSQPPTSKRKGADDSNPLNIAVKKARKEVCHLVFCIWRLWLTVPQTANKSGPSNKRKCESWSVCSTRFHPDIGAHSKR